MPETKEWTLMFYFASDNPLAPSIVSQLKAIKDAGYHPDANVITQFDPHTKKTPVHIFEVNLINKLKGDGTPNIGFGARDPYVRNLVADKLWIEKKFRELIRQALKPKPGQGSGAEGNKPINYDPPIPPPIMSDDQTPKESLAAFLDFCREHYPARHYLLIILGHGIVVGNDIFLHDEHAPKSSLLLTDLGEVLRKFKSDICEDDVPGQLEMIGFHSCSVSALEVAFEIKGTANYMLASQGPAFVGSWPYRQILIRIFNDLVCPPFCPDDLKPDKKGETDAAATRLAVGLKKGEDHVSGYLRKKFKEPTRKLLSQYNVHQPPSLALLSAIFEEFSNLIEVRELYDELAGWVKISEETKRLRERPPHGEDWRWLSRMVLTDAFPDELKRKGIKGPKGIREMLIKIFYYCLYNSYDFQLAGYSFDLTLWDLEKVRDVQKPLHALSLKLIKVLGYKPQDDGAQDDPPVENPCAEILARKYMTQEDPAQEGPTQECESQEKPEDKPSPQEALFRDLTILAHWDAQSFWLENYTDLYDFCFRLAKRCKDAEDITASQLTITALKDVQVLCHKLMDVLARGVYGKDKKMIVRCEFAGPLYQYSHGPSIFFPWAEPIGSRMWDKEYETYKLSKKTSWRKFLEGYFIQTRRPTQDKERRCDPHEQKPDEQPGHMNLEQQLLECLYQEISDRVFNDKGQLSMRHPNDLLNSHEKYGPEDPTGDNSCDLPVFKNYPQFTRSRRRPKRKDSTVPISPTFFEQFNIY